MRRSTTIAAALVAVAGALGLGFAGSAAETISITVRPTILRWAQSTTLTGSVSSGKAEVDVYIDAQTCGEGPWEAFSGAHTAEGGGFSAEFGAGITLLVRARAAGATSNEVKVQQRPSVQLQQSPRGTFFVLVNAGRSFWHKRVVLQRFDRARRTWVNLRTALLTESGGRPNSSFVWTKTDRFKKKVLKGTLIRATLPLRAAKPCYLAGYSNLLRS